MKIDWNKPIQTRNGHEVRIYTTEGQWPTYPVIGERQSDSRNWILERWTLNGLLNPGDSECESDIINVPEKHTLWLNIYAHGCARVLKLESHDTRKDADGYAPHDRIACVEVTFTEGEGL